MIWLTKCFIAFQLANAWITLPSASNRYLSRCSSSKTSVPQPFSVGSLPSSAADTIPTTEVETHTAPILRTLYDPPPRIDEFDASCPDAKFVSKVINGTLQTEEGSPHVLYYEVHQRIPVVDGKIQNRGGIKRGLTGLVLHGGPGAGCFPRHANFFSPELYEYVVLLDQRGCGRSTPLGEVTHNTLSLLVQDVEQLRSHLLDERPWDCILGGSWGCTLALAYAHSFPLNVRSMVLRGVCLFREREIDWLFGDPPPHDYSPVRTSNLRRLATSGKSANGKSTNSMKSTRASQLFSEGWKEFCKGVDLEDTLSNAQGNRNTLTQYYYRLLGSDPLIRARAAQSWFRYEMGVYSRGFKEQRSRNDTNTKLLVWDPIARSWHYETAHVCNNQSFISVDESSYEPVDEDVAQSLRRYSKSPYYESPQQKEIVAPSMNASLQPLPIKKVKDTTDIAASINANGGNRASNATIDPTKFIPAQAMLTCFYSTNDKYVLQDYRGFLSLSANASWYRSLPPATPHSQSSRQAYSLPPCIAINGTSH